MLALMSGALGVSTGRSSSGTRRSMPSIPPSHTIPRLSTKRDITSPIFAKPGTEKDFHEAYSADVAESRPTTGILGPSEKGLSKATHMDPEESRFEMTVATVLGATESRPGGVDCFEKISTPFGVKTATMP